MEATRLVPPAASARVRTEACVSRDTSASTGLAPLAAKATNSFGSAPQMLAALPLPPTCFGHQICWVPANGAPLRCCVDPGLVLMRV
jgi:hypothetical protein